MKKMLCRGALPTSDYLGDAKGCVGECIHCEVHDVMVDGVEGCLTDEDNCGMDDCTCIIMED